MSASYIVGVGMTPLGRHLELSIKQLSAAAIDAALLDAGIGRDDIEAAWFCNTRQGVMEGQHNIRGQSALRAYGFESIAIFNTDNACASSSSGLFQAHAAVEAGLFDLALVVGVEKMNYPDRRDQMFEAFKGSWDRDLMASHIDALIAASPPPPEVTTGDRSVFMDVYAAMARLHMQRHGLTQRQIAAVAAKNHWHSQFNPNAQYRHPIDIEAVLADKLVSWPLTRAMCAPMSDGACALVVASKRALSRVDRGRAVLIRGLAVTSGSSRPIADETRHLTRIAAQRAYAAAAVEPCDISVAELHDAAAVAEIIHSENCLLFEPGDGAAHAERGETRLDGRLPINPSGGLISKGHPTAATGAIQIYEIVTQLRGEAGARQVSGAKLGLTENGGGFHGIEEAACVVGIFEAPFQTATPDRHRARPQSLPQPDPLPTQTRD